MSCRLSWMIFLTNSSSPPSAMISVTPPVLTELGGGRREFLELTPCREQHDRQRLTPNPISSYGANNSVASQTRSGRCVFTHSRAQMSLSISGTTRPECAGCEKGAKSYLCLQLVGEKRRVAHAEIVHYFCLFLQGVHQ